MLFAVNSGSNSIAVFRILKNHSLKPIDGSPFDSHGTNPVSLGLKAEIFLVVVNKDGDPAQNANAHLPNYTTFRIGIDGRLTWIENSTREVALGSSPSQALISPFGPMVFGADFLGGLLQSFEISPHGRLERHSTLALPDSEFTGSMAPHLPLGLAANPLLPIVYVGFPTVNKIGVYEYDQQANLKFNRTVSDSGAVVCWLITNKNGSRLFASNTGDASVTVYDIANNPLQPQELQKISLMSQGGTYQLALSPAGNHLAVLTQRYQVMTPQGQGNELHILNFDKASQSWTDTSPIIFSLNGDTRPQGVVVVE